ncbi:RDD family protein [Bacillus sp. CLL-7-23]|uniref:RDD family protein n=1 Tax=Bacillus changyiensis TaxID=3004103 RepID=A0ABT4X1T0_9BACI|nr:RDD family protein [Bacillus changyiensis]MDA7026254.1 RDD family protein [Bacillus changyiensis]
MPDSNESGFYFLKLVLMYLIFIGAVLIWVVITFSFVFIISFLNYTLMESSKWKATIGKKVMGIQVLEKVK